MPACTNFLVDLLVHNIHVDLLSLVGDSSANEGSTLSSYVSSCDPSMIVHVQACMGAMLNCFDCILEKRMVWSDLRHRCSSTQLQRIGAEEISRTVPLPLLAPWE